MGSTATGQRPLALTLGDPAGIGPEVAAAAWAARTAHDFGPFFAIGDPAAVAAVWDGPLAPVTDLDHICAVFDTALPVWPVESEQPIQPGQPDSAGARASLHALECGVGLARSSGVDALVTGPVSKQALYGVGYTHPGQTEFIAERCGVTAENAVMMLAAPGLRVVPLTVHVPLAQVPQLLTRELILQKARVVARGLRRDFGVAEPRIAIAGLNPHAGENGHLGSEDDAIIAPAAAALRDEGIDVTGPVAADSLFAPLMRARYDAILCGYHDQALAPFKALHFHDGVNLTLGLPIVRTSPDHGTAFALAGLGEADPAPTIAALCCARRMADQRAACHG